MITIGIDPGNTGAIAVFKGDQFISVYDMPLMANGKKQQVNAAELARIIRDEIEPDFAVVERVSAMPGQGVSSMFNFGMGYGVIQGILAALGVGYTLVTPQKWKGATGLSGKDKDCARTMAQQLYPNAPLGRKKDLGRADAIMIAKHWVDSSQNT